MIFSLKSIISKKLKVNKLSSVKNDLVNLTNLVDKLLTKCKKCSKVTADKMETNSVL